MPDTSNRFVPHIIGNSWFVLDLVDNHLTRCHNQQQAVERANLCSGVWRLVQRRREDEEAIFQKVLAERMQLGIFPMPTAPEQPDAASIEQATTA